MKSVLKEKQTTQEQYRTVIVNLLNNNEKQYPMFYKWKIYNGKNKEFAEYIIMCNKEKDFESYAKNVWKHICEGQGQDSKIIEQRLMFKVNKDIANLITEFFLNKY